MHYWASLITFLFSIKKLFILYPQDTCFVGVYEMSVLSGIRTYCECISDIQNAGNAEDGVNISTLLLNPLPADHETIVVFNPVQVTVSVIQNKMPV